MTSEAGTMAVDSGAATGVAADGAGATKVLFHDLMDGLFGGLCSAPDWTASLAGMICSATAEEVAEGHAAIQLGGARMVKKVSPAIVVADSAYQSGGRIPGLCQRHCGAKFVALQCPGRPEPWGRAMVWMGLFRKHGSEIKKVIPIGADMDRRLEEETGPPLPQEEHTWLRLLPGCRALVERSAEKQDVFVGAFLSIPAAPLDTSSELA
eukprot:CAMPEP_0115338962 /NCGR_PEP_ID=MMETSP0270-20121206/90355_1 /TAXON_ID=71861 /ORGANISM="Scrippsiella trochoidea, Strain CCMP3099" /LENGTH=208 /DNA_ID=CAMNT_0002760309 /DNA_START=40 /DNA_END=663 /DNA_ORIENTATION=+